MFADRPEAGRQLASRLKEHARRADSVVLGISRGGVAVAYEVARRLGLTLDVLVVRRLLVPEHRLLTMGAVASGGIRVLDQAVIEETGVAAGDITLVERREREEVRRLESFYRDDREPLQLSDRTVIIVDDGIASGSTMLAAVACVRSRNPRRVIVAAPIAGARACEKLTREADEVICLETPEISRGPSQWYDDFRPVSAEAARDLLSQDSEVS